MTAPTVDCEGLVHIYRSTDTEVVALRGVDLIVNEGETVALRGPSGAGKSTLLWILAGLLRPSAGRLSVHGREISRMSSQQLDMLRAREIGVVLQDPARNLIPHANAGHNIAFAQRAGSAPRAERRALIADLLEAVGIISVAHLAAGRLSGGEQQRLALGVALANRPRLLLADEPTSQLDAASARAVVELLSEAPDRFGTTVVTVTHDPAVSAAFERTVTIRDGRIGTEGRRGEDYVVVGRDGSVMLPPHTHDVLPPGGLSRVIKTTDGVRIVRADPDERTS